MSFFFNSTARAAGTRSKSEPVDVSAATRVVTVNSLSALPRAVGRDRRRSPRYLCELRTACVVISLVEPVLLSARVRDLSQNGIGLLLPSRVGPGNFLAVKLQGPRDAKPRIMRAQVVRTVAQSDRRTWFHGCAFVGELSRDEVAGLL